MKNIELQNKAIIWLEIQSKTFRTRPQNYTPKEVAEGVGGTYGAVGKIADAVVKELTARGIAIEYLKIGNSRKFHLSSNPGRVES